MKTFNITVCGKTEIDIYNAVAHVRKLISNNNLSGEGTLVRGFLEIGGTFKFKSFGDYEIVLPAEIEEALKRSEKLLENSGIYFENSHEFEIKQLDQEEQNNYELKNPYAVYSTEIPKNSIVFHITVSGESKYGVEEFLLWIYNKICQRNLSQDLSSITMLPENLKGFCSFKSFGKYQNTFNSITVSSDYDEDDLIDSDNSYKAENSYCSACHQDPCECSDREKTSTIYDF
jgi:hypothetical protein